MNARATTLIAVFNTGVLLGGAAAMAEFAPPKIGTELGFECTGAWGTSHTTAKVVSLKDGIVRAEGQRHGKAHWAENPIWAGPTTIFSKKDRGDGKGERGMKIVSGNLEELAKLEPGRKLGGDVKEWRSTESWKWKY